MVDPVGHGDLLDQAVEVEPGAGGLGGLRVRAQERRLVPETIARFLQETAPLARLALKPIKSLPHTFEPGATPTALREYESKPGWRLPRLG